jgi:hypothetical protein
MPLADGTKRSLCIWCAGREDLLLSRRERRLMNRETYQIESDLWYEDEWMDAFDEWEIGD